MCKFICVCGGVFSGCGKGITACSIGLLLKSRNLKVTYTKFDGYINSDCGIIRPSDHGECFVLDSGAEVDLDLGSAERIMGVNMDRKNIATSGVLYKQLLEEQENGIYLGDTIQITPHLTNLIQRRFLELGKENDVVVIEIGGVVGDPENHAYFEALRQFKHQYHDDVLVTMVAPVLWVPTIQEFKTKPLQTAVRELQKAGLQLDVLFCRADRTVPEAIFNKISNLTGTKRECIFPAYDVKSIYQVPLSFYENHVDDLFVDLFRLRRRNACRIHKYKEVVEKLVREDLPNVKIGVVCKYDHPDAYLSLKEAITHAGAVNEVKPEVVWIKAEDLEKCKNVSSYFEGISGVIVPGGFDTRGVEGKIRAINYIRENKIPFLGICLGLQCAVIEFTRNVLGLGDANSLEFNKSTLNPVINFVEGQEKTTKKAGTMRLGSYDCELVKDTLAHRLYNVRAIKERHRHRYEVNKNYIDSFEAAGLMVSGRNPGTDLVEIMELTDHPFFIGTQFHPEFKSTLINQHPLFDGFVKAAMKYQQRDK